MGTKHNYYKVLALLSGILIIVGLIITCVARICTDEYFYSAQFKMQNTAKELGIEQQEVEGAMSQLLDYIQEKTPTIDYKVIINGVEQSLFNEREISHMSDVRNLYQNAKMTGIAFLILGTFGYALLGIKKQATLSVQYYLKSLGVFLGLVAVILVWAILDFYNFWSAFHRLFFTNDLYLLNPATDRMIIMMNQRLFYNLVLWIVLTCLTVLGLTVVVALLYLKKHKGPLQSVKEKDEFIQS